MNLPAEGTGAGARADRWVRITVFLVLFWMHFSAGPNDFVLDDWTNLKDYATKPGAEILDKALGHPSRPLSLFFVMGAFRLLGDHPAAFYALSLVCQAVLLELVLRLSRALGQTRLTGAFAALGFACWPMISEMIRWPTMVAGAAACALPAYLFALLGFARYCREGGGRRLALAGAAYAAGIFCYESGIFLPAACLALLTRPNLRRVVAVGATCAACLGVYAAWRLSNAFGRATFQLAGQFTPEFSLSAAWWNARESARLVVEAWVAPALEWPLPAWGLLLVAFAASWIALARRGWRLPADGNPGAPGFRPTLFGLLWLACGMIPALIGYSAGRVLYLPAVGASLALAPALARAVRRPLPLALLGAGFLSVFFINRSAQRDWIVSGEVQRAMRARLVANNDTWRREGRTAVLIDCRKAPPTRRPRRDWPYSLGQAGFLRGFALENLAFGVPDPLPVYLDRECGLVRGEGGWTWHRRFRPEHPLSATDAEVVVLEPLDFLRVEPVIFPPDRGSSPGEPAHPAEAPINPGKSLYNAPPSGVTFAPSPKEPHR